MRSTQTTCLARRWAHWGALALVVFAWVSPCAAAPAADGDDLSNAFTTLSPDARAKLHQGELLFADGNYEAAILKFEEVRDASPDWKAIHFNLGVAAEALGDLNRAIQEYIEYRNYAPISKRGGITERIEYLQAKLDADQPGMRIAGISFVGVGGAVLIASGALYLDGVVANSQIDGEPSDISGREARLDRVENANTISPILAGVGAGLAMVGVGLWVGSSAKLKKFNRAQATAGDTAIRIEPGPGAGEIGIGLRMRF